MTTMTRRTLMLSMRQRSTWAGHPRHCRRGGTRAEARARPGSAAVSSTTARTSTHGSTLSSPAPLVRSPRPTVARVEPPGRPSDRHDERRNNGRDEKVDEVGVLGRRMCNSEQHGDTRGDHAKDGGRPASRPDDRAAAQLPGTTSTSTHFC